MVPDVERKIGVMALPLYRLFAGGKELSHAAMACRESSSRVRATLLMMKSLVVSCGRPSRKLVSRETRYGEYWPRSTG
jgi:hypothetical protein